MAGQKRKKFRTTLKYFYVNGELHKRLRISRSADLITAWNYKQGKRVAYIYSDVQSRMQRAYSVSEVSKIFKRHKRSINRYLFEDSIKRPEKTYSLDERKVSGVYYFSEDNLRELREYLSTLSINVGYVPTVPELESMIKNETVLYIKNEYGEFVPVWKQPEW
mgnify:FL=1